MVAAETIKMRNLKIVAAGAALGGCASSATDRPPAYVSPAAYRADIDVLRAIAVLSVLCFHWNVRPLSGGFVGVDVFFVISGYLITRLISAETKSGHFIFCPVL